MEQLRFRVPLGELASYQHQNQIPSGNDNPVASHPSTLPRIKIISNQMRNLKLKYNFTGLVDLRPIAKLKNWLLASLSESSSKVK